MTDIAGKWTYRSFHNNPVPVGGDAEKALRLIFAEAVFTFEISGNELTGYIKWGDDGLVLKGNVQPASTSTTLSVQMVGTGSSNLGTDGWEYDYNACLAHQWPNGINQVPALVGSVIRAKPHGTAPAGYVASFVAVKQP